MASELAKSIRDWVTAERMVLMGFAAIVLYGCYLTFIGDTYDELATVPETFRGELVKIYREEPGDLAFSENETLVGFKIGPSSIAFRNEGESQWTTLPVSKVLEWNESRISILYRTPGASFDSVFEISLRPNNVYRVYTVTPVGGSVDASAYFLEGHYQQTADIRRF